MATNIRLSVWLALTAVFLATTAAAAPPDFHYQTHWFNNSAGAFSCNNFDFGYQCRSIDAWEVRDVKGKYWYTTASLYENSFQFDPNDGSYMFSWRVLQCAVDRQALRTSLRNAALDASLDSASPACYTDGWRESWDPINGYQSQPYPFDGVYALSGNWADPINSDKGNSQRQNRYSDPWSGTTTKIVYSCHDSYANTMADGGFSINGDFMPFRGFDDPDTWSWFSSLACHENALGR